jgi:hypothetical protein
MRMWRNHRAESTRWSSNLAKGPFVKQCQHRLAGLDFSPGQPPFLPLAPFKPTGRSSFSWRTLTISAKSHDGLGSILFTESWRAQRMSTKLSVPLWGKGLLCLDLIPAGKESGELTEDVFSPTRSAQITNLSKRRSWLFLVCKDVSSATSSQLH